MTGKLYGARVQGPFHGEEQENPNTYLASFNGPVVKYQEEAESIAQNIKGETSFGVSSTMPQEKES
jgi:hypothetical protein